MNWKGCYMITVTCTYLKHSKGRSSCMLTDSAVSGHKALDTLITQTMSNPYVFLRGARHLRLSLVHKVKCYSMSNMATWLVTQSSQVVWKEEHLTRPTSFSLEPRNFVSYSTALVWICAIIFQKTSLAWWATEWQELLAWLQNPLDLG